MCRALHGHHGTFNAAVTTNKKGRGNINKDDEASTASHTTRNANKRSLKIPDYFPPAVPSTTSTHGHFVLFPVSLASRDQYGGQLNSRIDIYDLTGK